jgi:hypothetical protein
MKKELKAYFMVALMLVVGFLVLSGLGAAAVTSEGTLSSQDQLEFKESGNTEELVFPFMDIHVEEIYGTLENPQYRPLPDVTVESKDSLFGFIWSFHWRGITHENGATGDIMIINSIMYKITVSKEGYHTYKCSSTQILKTTDLWHYDVYFTMAEDGSPFTQHIDVHAQSQSGSQQSLASSSSQNELLQREERKI